MGGCVCVWKLAASWLHNVQSNMVAVQFQCHCKCLTAYKCYRNCAALGSRVLLVLVCAPNKWMVTEILITSCCRNPMACSTIQFSERRVAFVVADNANNCKHRSGYYSIISFVGDLHVAISLREYYQMLFERFSQSNDNFGFVLRFLWENSLRIVNTECAANFIRVSI